MAKKSMVNRDLKRVKIAKKYAARRLELKRKVANPKTSYDERAAAQTALQKLPRDASPTRSHNRCQLTGRSKGVLRKFKVSRIMLRELALAGKIPGLKKASW